ncbi:serine-type endopeptidase [Aureococcus anophagefferens]|nr:serine-type endopeptidase [Aureococcus anophagefferens]
MEALAKVAVAVAVPVALYTFFLKQSGGGDAPKKAHRGKKHKKKKDKDDAPAPAAEPPAPAAAAADDDPAPSRRRSSEEGRAAAARARPGGAERAGGAEYEVGARVEARYEHGAEWFAGSVVLADRLRRLGPAAPAAAPAAAPRAAPRRTSTASSPTKPGATPPVAAAPATTKFADRLQGSVPKPRGASRLKKERNRLLRDDAESDGESDDESDYDPDVILSEADWKQAVARKPNRPKIIEVEKVLIHPDYDTWTSENDVALMFLSEPAPCAADGRTKTVTLDRSDSFDPYVGEKLMVAGWGATNKQGSKYPNKLHEVALDFIDTDACASKWGPGYISPDVMLCAWDPNEEKDSCFADSGGPLFVDTADGGATEIGINAFVTEGGGSLSEVESGTCASSWTTGDEGCHETQIDCPPTPCDGDAGGPWCVDVGGTSWFYCAPEPVTTTTTTAAPFLTQIESGTCLPFWTTGNEGCRETQIDCPPTPCDGDAGGPWSGAPPLRPRPQRAWCVDVGGASWFYCTPESEEFLEKIESGTCASAWNTGDPGCEEVAQSGCPAAPCDGDKNGPWCVDVDGASWFYCTPPEGVTTTAKPSCPATCFGQTCDHWAEADGDTRRRTRDALLGLRLRGLRVPQRHTVVLSGDVLRETCDHWAEADGDTRRRTRDALLGLRLRWLRCPNDTPTSTDPCAVFSKKRCKKQGSCSWNKNSKTCSDGCSAISDKKACKKSQAPCEWKQKLCQAVDCSGKSKQQCKKGKYKKACKYKKKRGGCIPK